MLARLHVSAARQPGRPAATADALICGPVVSLTVAAAPQVSSIGYIGGDKNISITQQLSAVVEKHLGIPPARVYVNVRLAFASEIRS